MVCSLICLKSYSRRLETYAYRENRAMKSRTRFVNSIATMVLPLDGYCRDVMVSTVGESRMIANGLVRIATAVCQGKRASLSLLRA